MSLRGCYRESAVIAAVLAAAVVPSTATGDEDCLAWMERLPAPSPRSNHAMAYDSARGVTVMFGGYPSQDGRELGDTWEWDGEAWALRATSGPPRQFRHAMVYDARRGVTVLFGGGETWEWDGKTWTFRPQAGPAPRSDHAITYDVARGVTVLFGGYSYDSREHLLLADTWEWDGKSWTLRAVTGPPPRAGHALAYDEAHGETVLFGGYGSDYELADTWSWNGTTWSARADLGPAARAGHAMTYDSVRNVTVLTGGIWCWAPDAPCRETWEWDGAAWTLVARTGPADREAAAMVFDSAIGMPVLFGGIALGGTVACGTSRHSDTWLWDGASWIPASDGVPSPRYGHAMAYDSSRGVSVLIGGRRDSYPLMGTWEWDGTEWSLRNIAGPWDRYGHAVAFDSSRNVTVLFGGEWRNTGEISGATWEWDGEDWQQLRESGPARYGHAMAYDSARQMTVMFGGIIDEDEAGDTWQWNGYGWWQASTGGPLARVWHAMAYDSDREVVVLFGGKGDECGGLCGDTWEWDGMQWDQRSDEGPGPRSNWAMVYDVTRQKTVLFGGVSEGYEFTRETWEWDGSEWTRRRISAPRGRSGHAMAYDTKRGVTVLFGGGIDSYSPWADTWEYAPDSIADADFDGVADECDACPASSPEHRADETGCAPADSDLDGDVDLRDFAALQICFFSYPVSPECARFDPDYVPDYHWFMFLEDFQDFLDAMTGPSSTD